MMVRKILLLAMLAAANPIQAKRVVVIHGGEVHMQGALVNGGCAIALESQKMTVQMGQHSSHFFKGIGSYAPPSIPFSIRLANCHPEVYEHVGIAFKGATSAEEPLLFLAISSVRGNDASSGLGLAIFDQKQQLIIPNSEPASYSRKSTQEINFHFTARYRSVARHMSPVNIRTGVWLTLVYS